MLIWHCGKVDQRLVAQSRCEAVDYQLLSMQPRHKHHWLLEHQSCRLCLTCGRQLSAMVCSWPGKCQHFNCICLFSASWHKAVVTWSSSSDDVTPCKIMYHLAITMSDAITTTLSITTSLSMLQPVLSCWTCFDLDNEMPFQHSPKVKVM